MATATQALAKKDRVEKLSAMVKSDKVATAIKQLLPKHIEYGRFLMMVDSAIRTTPQLSMCTAGSVVRSVLSIAQLGLELDPQLGQACIVPYKRKGILEAQPQVMYRGFITLAHRGGSIAKISAEVRYSKDKFEINKGTERRITHIPTDEEDPGEMVGVYATVRFKDGTYDFEYLTKAQVLKIRARARSAGSDDSPWNTAEDEMWRKTAVRRLMKYLPLSPEDSILTRAILVDEAAEVGKVVEHPQIPADLVAEPPPMGRVIREGEAEAEIVEIVEGETEIPLAPVVGLSFIGKDKKTALLTGDTKLIEEEIKARFGAKLTPKGWELNAAYTDDVLALCQERGAELLEAEGEKPAEAKLKIEEASGNGLVKMTGVASAVQGPKKSKKGSEYYSLQLSGKTLFVWKTDLFDYISRADGHECCFVVRISAQDFPSVESVLKIGALEWLEDGTPVVRR